jgi:hypothetical protein
MTRQEFRIDTAFGPNVAHEVAVRDEMRQRPQISPIEVGEEAPRRPAWATPFI